MGDFDLTNETNKLHSFIDKWPIKIFVCEDVGDANLVLLNKPSMVVGFFLLRWYFPLGRGLGQIELLADLIFGNQCFVTSQ